MADTAKCGASVPSMRKSKMMGGGMPLKKQNLKCLVMVGWPKEMMRRTQPRQRRPMARVQPVAPSSGSCRSQTYATGGSCTS